MDGVVGVTTAVIVCAVVCVGAVSCVDVTVFVVDVVVPVSIGAIPMSVLVVTISAVVVVVSVWMSGVDVVSFSVVCGGCCGARSQASQTPGVPRSVTPGFIPNVVVAVIQTSPDRIIVAFIGRLVPAGGMPPVPTESTTVPDGSMRSIWSLEFESDTDVVTRCVVVARMLLASFIA